MYQALKKEEPKQKTIQKKDAKKPNSTGIPDTLKTKYENHSGFSFDDVRVHYNSDKPAQFQALAYTQGNQVFVAPKQEMHLEHELGHVVQQKQGIVKPTGYRNNIPVNTDRRLEREVNNPYSSMYNMEGREKNESKETVGNCIQMLEVEEQYSLIGYLSNGKIDTLPHSILLKVLSNIINKLNEDSKKSSKKIKKYKTIKAKILDDKIFDKEYLKEALEKKELEGILETVINELSNTINEKHETETEKNDKIESMYPTAGFNPTVYAFNNFYTDNFRDHHFANTFEDAREKSRTRFLLAPHLATNTVILTDQLKKFALEESAKHWARGVIYTSNNKFTYWEFHNPQQANEDKLCKSQIQYGTNGEGDRIQHFQGPVGTVTIGDRDQMFLLGNTIKESLAYVDCTSNPVLESSKNHILNRNQDILSNWNNVDYNIEIGLNNIVKALFNFINVLKICSAVDETVSTQLNNVVAELENVTTVRNITITNFDELYDLIIEL